MLYLNKVIFILVVTFSLATYAKSNTSKIAVGYLYHCAIIKDQIKCKPNKPSRPPMSIPHHFEKPQHISASFNYFCVLDTQTVKCWKDDGVPIAIPFKLNHPRNVAVGDFHICILDKDGLKCFGDNEDRQSTPPASLGRIQHLSSGFDNNCVTDLNQKATCWGYNFYGQSTIPAEASHLSFINTGFNVSCGINLEQKIICWGDNRRGQTDVPKNILNPIKVVAGEFHTCALTTSEIKCWGDDSIEFPPKIPNPIDIDIYFNSTCALYADGTVCWGDKEVIR